MNTPQTQQTQTQILNLEITEADLNSISADEIEIVALQAHLLKESKEENRRLKKKIEFLTSELSSAELSNIEQSNELDQLTDKIASLIEENRAANAKADNAMLNGVAMSEHQAVVDELDRMTIRFEANKASLLTTIKDNHAFERRLTDLQAREGMAVRQLEEKARSLKDLELAHERIKSELAETLTKHSAVLKTSKQQQQEIDGFKTRIENAQKSAVAQYIEAQRNVAPATAPAASAATLEELAEKQARILALESEIEDLRATNANLREENAERLELSHIAQQAMTESEKHFDEFQKQLAKYVDYAKKCAEITASLKAENLLISKRNANLELYCNLIEGQPLNVLKDKSILFMLPRRFNGYLHAHEVRGADIDRNYPVYWLMQLDGQSFPLTISADHKRVECLTAAEMYLDVDIEKEIVLEIKETQQSVADLHFEQVKATISATLDKAEFLSQDLFDYNLPLADFLAKCMSNKVLSREDYEYQLEAKKTIKILADRFKTRRQIIVNRVERQHSTKRKKKRK